ncbi:N-terminal domain intergin-like repeats and c-terminal-cell wall-associated hydrolase domain [Sorangium cellulosum So ce56]|uniref:N-terminal domain intergin-like repeats and c-terminal-cell wall-associated hydrolase domain n=2 Tax=Sorangium TaxID=39643 RepID=A9GRM0_SORC5|nr:integrin-like repeat-containing cell wall-associated hydrolase [Sorangium cellulosum]CAN93643.1 N-terminal domain intergin-like repeats and c-terminal-cell wall-associated hydrolase domain [Sorangium cellulosum So ce56]
MGDTLNPGGELVLGQRVVSADGKSRLTFGGDGDLVLSVKRLSRNFWLPRWASGTAGRGADRCAMQGDGNLVIYAGATPLWASNTAGSPNARLVVQDDENVVLYLGATPIWSTDTWVKPAVRTSFAPTRHGFRFANGFPNVTIAGINFGFQGLCGGMSWAALDYFHASEHTPDQTTKPDVNADPLGIFIMSRHIQASLNSSNVGHWMPMLLNPDDNAVRHWSTHDEWKKLKASLDAGAPIPIGLAKFLDAFGSHVVVATGYQEGKGDFTIYCYDPNEVNGECILYLDRSWKHWRFFPSGGTSGDFRGYFVQDGYSSIPLFSVPVAGRRLVLYDHAAGEGDVVGFLNDGDVALDRTNRGWRKSWSALCAGNFLGDGSACIALYDRGSGDADLVAFDGRGALRLDHTHSGWRKSWDLVAAGDFLGNGRSQLLLYDRGAGEAAIVGFDGHGAFNFDHTHSGWRKSWDLVAAGDFLGNGRSQLLLYDRGAGEAAIVGFDGHGAFDFDRTHSGWRKSWDLVAAGDFLGNGRSQLLLYDRGAGEAAIVGFDGHGAFNFDRTYSGWRKSWDLVAAGDFLGTGRSQLLLYDRSAGEAHKVGFDGHGELVSNHTNKGWRKTWSLIAPL